MQDSITNPNSGTTSYIYNAFGELTSQKDAMGKTYNLQYNTLGGDSSVSEHPIPV